MYDPRNLFKQKPESIKALILAVLAALVVTDVIDLSGEAVAAWGLVVERLLSALYVEPVKKALSEEEKAKTEADLRELADALAPVNNITNVTNP